MSVKNRIMNIMNGRNIEERENPSYIVELIIKEKQFIFKTFNDSRIPQVEDLLNERGTDYMTTSQTGSDYVIATKGSHFYERFKNLK